MNVSEFLKITNPKFKDFMNLRVGGKDKFSELRITALRKAMPQDVQDRVRDLDLPYKEEAKVYRWILRGLPVEHAIRKVQVDMEVAENARYAQEKRDFWDSEDAMDIALKALKEEDVLEDIFHTDDDSEELNIAGYILIRDHPNRVTITKADGEVICEKEIRHERHWENFLQKFKSSEEYRRSLEND